VKGSDASLVMAFFNIAEFSSSIPGHVFCTGLTV
jgi:hypothetical protein